MKKYLLLALFALILFGCTANTPWGDFNVKPDSQINVTVNTPDTGADSTGSSGSSSSSSGTSGSSDSSSGASGSSGTTISPTNEEELNVLYFDPESNTFTIEIDGIQNSNYDYVGAKLKPGERPAAYDYEDLFVGDYPSSSPRDVVIKSRVLLGSRDLEIWRKSVLDGNLQRKNFRIVVRDEDNLEVAEIHYTNAWPSDYRLIVTPDSFDEIVVLTVESISVESN